MNSSGDFSIQNFQSIVQNYEIALKDVTEELDSVQAEQDSIKKTITDYDQLSIQLNKILSNKTENYEIEHKFHENDFIENLKAQLRIVTEEKDLAIKLWQNAADSVEHLEGELKIYQENTQGLIPKSKLIQLKNSYEEKLNNLQATVTQTKAKLEETINLKTRELQIKDIEITGSVQSHNNTFKIIKNLEDEVLNLQKRLNVTNENKYQLEKDTKSKNAEIQLLKLKTQDCRVKVEEALQCVEAALNEKDAALLREATAKEEAKKLSQTMNHFIEETNTKIKDIQRDHDIILDQMRQELLTTKELVKVKENDADIYTKRCTMLETELENLQSGRLLAGENSTSKMLVLEKNLENTFQKLLLSEKQNIQLRAEINCVQSDLEQMSHHYERDVNLREAEKVALKNEIQKLKAELDENNLKVTKSSQTINNLNDKISTMEVHFKEQIRETRSTCQQTCMEWQEMETAHNQIIQEIQEQLISQTEINKKWRAETKSITEELEKIILELKGSNNKMKHEIKSLNEKLKEANMKMYEYRKFLEMISHDVTKITTITLPATGESAK